MPKIVDGKIYHNGEKIGWIDGRHFRATDNTKVGYYEGNDLWSESVHKIAYIQENMLKFENGNTSIPLEKINEEVEGTYPLIIKCAVHVFFED